MKVIKIILAIIIAVFLIIGVPIIINEFYKSNLGIVTVWTGADVLGYYGSILGSAIAVVTLIATIIFTKKQIQRDSYLKSKGEKWDKLDSAFMKVLDNINPIEVLKCVMDTGYIDPAKAINHLQKYQVNCKIACDQLNASLSVDDYPNFESLIESINITSEQFVRNAQMLTDIYSDFQSLNHRDTATETLEMERKCPGSFSQEIIDLNKDILKKTESMTFPDIKLQVTKANDDFIKAYETQYKNLLQLKGSTFEVVRRATCQHADDILNLRRK